MILLVKAFIFDLDGVITDTAELHYKAWEKLAKEIGVSIDRTCNEKLKGMNRLDSLEIILKCGGIQGTFSKEEKIAFAAKKNIYYKKLIAKLTPKDILPNMNTLLEEIRTEGYKIGLASASENAPAIIKALGIEHFFQAIADPKKVKHGKPAPDLFLLAAKQLKVMAKECIGIEDAVSGVAAIKQANMFAVGIGDQNQLSKADYIVHTTKELTLSNLIIKWEKWHLSQEVSTDNL